MNSRGQAVMGVGDGIVSVDRRPLIYRAGAACWLDDETVLANALEPGNIWAVVRCRVSDADIDAVEDPPEGASDLVAGGGRWLGWNSRRGMFGSLGDWSAAGVIAAGRDGTLAYCRDRQSGRGFVLNTPDRRETEVTGAVVYDMQVLGPTSALWYDGQGVQVVGRQAPRFAAPPGRTRLVTVDGEDWLIYWSESVGLLAHPDGAAEGYVLESLPIAFNHDAIAVDGEIVIVWSRTPGEGPGDLEWRALDRMRPRVPFAVPVPAIGRPLWLGWFQFGGGSPDTPGNCALSVDPQMLVRAPSGAIVAQYVAGQPEGDLDALDRALAAAAVTRPSIPRLAYWTRGPQGMRLPRGADLIGIEAYRGVDETPAAFERRVRFAIAQSPRAWLIAQGYTSNASLDTDLAALVPVYARVARDCPNVEGILVFSAGTRLTGWNGHPEIHDAWRQLAAGIPAAPPIVIVMPPPPSPPPKEPTVPAKTNDEVRRDIAELVRFYNDADGLNRAARGIPPPITVDDPAFWDWVALSVTTPIEQVKARIRTFPEWVEQHQGQEPP